MPENQQHPLIATVVSTDPGAEYEVQFPGREGVRIDETMAVYWRLANVLDDIGDGKFDAEN